MWKFLGNKNSGLKMYLGILAVLSLLLTVSGTVSCHFHFRFRTHVDTSNFKTLVQFRGDHTRSHHLAGHAVDFNIIYKWKTYESPDMGRENLNALPKPVRTFIRTVRETPGLRWGGDFNTQDPVHIDTGLNRKHPHIWDRYYAACLKDYSSAGPLWKSGFSRLFL